MKILAEKPFWSNKNVFYWEKKNQFFKTKHFILLFVALQSLINGRLCCQN